MSSFLKLFCKDDLILDLLHNHFEATILKIPEGRIKPGSIIEKIANENVFKFRGQLDALSTFDIPDLGLDKLVIPTSVASISGEKTQLTKTEFGLQVLNGFLKGFGVNIPKLDTHFKDVTKVSFSFENIKRHSIDNGALGKDLIDFRLDKKSAATAGFFYPKKNQLLFIDSIITSNDFTIHTEEFISDNISINVSAIKEELGKVSSKINVESNTKTSITFKGEEALPFAFTTIRLKNNEEGNIIEMPPFVPKEMNLMGRAQEEYIKTKLTDELGLVDIEFPSD